MEQKLQDTAFVNINSWLPSLSLFLTTLTNISGWHSM